MLRIRNAWAMDCSLNAHNLAHAKAQLAAKRRPSISIPWRPQTSTFRFKTYSIFSCIHPYPRRQTHEREDRQSSSPWIRKLENAPAASKNHSAAGLLSRWKHDCNDHWAWTVRRLAPVPSQRRIQRVFSLAAFRHRSSGIFRTLDFLIDFVKCQISCHRVRKHLVFRVIILIYEITLIWDWKKAKNFGYYSLSERNF